MESLQKTKTPLALVLKQRGISVQDLARSAKLEPSTVRVAVVQGGTRQTNESSAQAIARTLNMDVDEIEWANGLTDVGRHAHTGGTPCIKKQSPDRFCPVHGIALPLSNVCDMCA